jgi:hypothetical protein
LSFLIVCLGACFADVADHGCCPPTETSILATGRDCCAVVPSESPGDYASPAPLLASFPISAPKRRPEGAPSLAPEGVVAVAPSPPLVLRI